MLLIAQLGSEASLPLGRKRRMSVADLCDSGDEATTEDTAEMSDDTADTQDFTERTETFYLGEQDSPACGLSALLDAATSERREKGKRKFAAVFRHGGPAAQTWPTASLPEET